MINQELPQLSSYQLTSSSCNVAALQNVVGNRDYAGPYPAQNTNTFLEQSQKFIAEQGAKKTKDQREALRHLVPQAEKPKEKPMSCRIVRVFIVDTDEALKVEDRVLYRGEEKLTDSTDQELFFEVDIKAALETHNAKRVSTADKKASIKMGKEIFLEPVRIKDLSMVVTEIAKF